MANPGDKIKVITEEKEYEGILIPNNETDSIILKLGNGYNIGINKKKIRKIQVIETSKTLSNNKIKHTHNKNKKTITVLHTGGTIASKVDYKTGGVIAQFSAEDLITMVPELDKMVNVQTELVANMMSEDMNFSDYQKLAKAIKKHAENSDGIIIGHGTDTLSYTAAALSFIFEEINIPVLLVGSQRSSDRGSTDSASNLIAAAEFIINTDFTGIAVCMHHSMDDKKIAILPGTKTRKMHTSRRDAFKAINDSPIALVDYTTKKIEILNTFSPQKKIVIKDKFSEEVGLLKTYTNMKNEVFEFYTKNFKAIVFEGTGLGHMPTNTKENLKNYETIKRFIENGGIAAITSQCIYGRVHPNVYTNLRRLANIGCIFCEDMLPETAYLKLSWLLGNYDKEKAKQLLAKSLRGEITERSLPDEYLE